MDENTQRNKQNDSWLNFFMRYKIYMITIVVLLLVIVVLVWGLGDDEQKDSLPSATPGVGSEGDAQSETDSEQQVEEELPNDLEENAHASIDRLIHKYLDCLANGDLDTLEEILDVLPDDEKDKLLGRADVIDSYEDVVCYTKRGLEEDSYIVFVRYEMKLSSNVQDIQTRVPGIYCLSVSAKDENGDRHIRGNADEDENLLSYVEELEKDPEVMALYDDVEKRYQEALEADKNLNDYIQIITGQAEDAEEENPEENEETSEEEEENSEESEEQNSEEEQPTEEETSDNGGATPQNRQTRVTASVNLRSEPTTESERVTLIFPGEKITQIESYDNGWSKVEYNGQTGYMMTEYIE